MIIIAGTIDYATRADRDSALQSGTALQLSTRETEPGCHAYSFSADPCLETRIVVYELWADEASLASHFLHDNYFAMGAALREGKVESNNRKFRVDLSEPVYDETKTPRADFFTAPSGRADV